MLAEQPGTCEATGMMGWWEKNQSQDAANHQLAKKEERGSFRMKSIWSGLWGQERAPYRPHSSSQPSKLTVSPPTPTEQHLPQHYSNGKETSKLRWGANGLGVACRL